MPSYMPRIVMRYVGSEHLYVSGQSLTDGQYWSDCKPRAEPSVFLASKTGMRATEVYWKEVKEHLEMAEPGCTAWLKQ